MNSFLKEGFSLAGWLADTLAREDPGPSFPAGSDAYWMAKALRLSMPHIGHAAPNPAVGCLFVKNGQMIASGATMVFGGLHAERKAIADCADISQLNGSTCYVTLEPCSHHGKQPPCIEALLAARIKRCVIALKDPFPGVDGAGIKTLQNHGVEVKVGVLAAECAAWHLPFLLQQHLGRPAVIGKWAQTLDGQMADDRGQSKWITGESARRHTHFLRQKYDAIAVGGPTACLDQPSLNVRDIVGPISRHPKKLIYDPKGRLLEADASQRKALGEKLLQGETVFWGVCPQHLEGHGDKKWWTSQKGLVPVELTEAEQRFGDFLLAVAKLYPAYNDGKALQSVLVEGGPALLSHLIEDDLLDAAHVFINPSLMGGRRYRIAPDSHQCKTEDPSEPQGRMIDDRLYFEPISLHSLGQDILWELLARDRFQLIMNGLEA